MRNISKFTWTMLVLAMISLAMIGCRQDPQGGGGGGQNNIAGNIGKGPLLLNTSTNIPSIAMLFQLDIYGARTGMNMQVNIDDDLGHYAFNNVPWAGLSEVEGKGEYLDENTGLPAMDNAGKRLNGSVTAVVTVPSNPQGTVITTVNANAATTIATSILKSDLYTNPAMDVYSVGATIQTIHTQVATSFGINVIDSYGAPIDLNILTVLDTTTTVNQQLLAFSAMIMDLTAAQGTTNTFLSQLATDLYTNQPLGTTTDVQSKLPGGSTITAIDAAKTKIVNNSTTIINNIGTIINNNTTVPANPAFIPPAPAVINNFTTVVNTVITTIVNPPAPAVPAVISGLAASNNQVTIGGVLFNVAANGAVTPATLGATVPVNNVVVTMNLNDLSNATGTGPSAQTYNSILSFSIASTTDTRLLQGTLPIVIITDGLGSTSGSVAAGAVLNFTGTTSAGLAVKGTATNLAANLIQPNANGISLDANALLAVMQAKVKAIAPSLNVLATAGTFNFGFALSGINLGTVNTANTAIVSLLPLGGQGRGVSGTVTTK